MKKLSLITYKSKTREQIYHNSSWLQTDRLPEFAVHWTLESSQDLRGVSSFSSRADGTKKWISVHFMDWSPIWNNSKLNIHTCTPEKINEFNIFSIQTSYCTITREH